MPCFRLVQNKNANFVLGPRICPGLTTDKSVAFWSL